ncbi:hypothetical protein RIVM261_071490 [Rivularia sp. IAM M-261]|nr:hypothetical protein CAL7716_019430 [Calothrix sp. PCC 7716]GJD22193.1 hypothetical protein RIVM261_071490 [Rivularia sp. IAM M-261]
MLTTNQLLSELRTSVEELYSPKVQLEMERQPESVKQQFLKQRAQTSNYLHNLETQELKKLVEKMKPLESELKKAIQDLNRELQSINNTVKFISSINAVTRVLARLVMIF